jgi:hypothetical protein
MSPLAHVLIGVAAVPVAGVGCDRFRRTRLAVRFAAAVLLAIEVIDYAVRRWQWAADLAWSLGLISEDDL